MQIGMDLSSLEGVKVYSDDQISKEGFSVLIFLYNHVQYKFELSYILVGSTTK